MQTDGVVTSADTPLISLSPLFDYLKKLGYKTHGEYVVIGGWPVQFLPPADALGGEALAEAVTTEVKGAPARIMTTEHLVANALRVGRAKDHARIVQFVESGALDPEKLDDILTRHNLLEAWERCRIRFSNCSGA